MGPLALMAKQAGLEVAGSDLAEGAILPELEAAGIEVEIGAQDGVALRKFAETGGETWLVRTSALPEDAAEMEVARELGLRISKRDELIAYLVEELGLKMVAVAGTHGKTTTTGMIIWGCVQLGIPAAYLVGTTLGFAAAGSFNPGDKYFIYEADEYDRNFLHYHPWLSVITYVSYDHPDIYPTEKDYQNAFSEFEKQSGEVIKSVAEEPKITLPGRLRREDATMAYLALKRLRDDARGLQGDSGPSDNAILEALNAFPGVFRRFERVTEGVYSDYAHHPEEVEATIEMAREEAELGGFTGVVVVYEPHQNTRQHQIHHGYKTAFSEADKVFWLPTYLTREDQSLKILTPGDFVAELTGVDAEVAEADAELAEKLKKLREQGYLIVLMTAGPADGWLRKVFHE